MPISVDLNPRALAAGTAVQATVNYGTITEHDVRFLTPSNRLRGANQLEETEKAQTIFIRSHLVREGFINSHFGCRMPTPSHHKHDEPKVLWVCPTYKQVDGKWVEAGKYDIGTLMPDDREIPVNRFQMDLDEEMPFRAVELFTGIALFTRGGKPKPGSGTSTESESGSLSADAAEETQNGA